jgi:hypothetical protein
MGKPEAKMHSMFGTVIKLQLPDDAEEAKPILIRTCSSLRALQPADWQASNAI